MTLISGCQAVGSAEATSDDEGFAAMYREISTELTSKFFVRPRYYGSISGYMGVDSAKFEISAAGDCILEVRIRSLPAIKVQSIELEVLGYDQLSILRKQDLVSLRGNFSVGVDGTVRIAIPGEANLSFHKNSPPWSLSGNQKARAAIWLKDLLASRFISFKIKGVSPRAAELASNIEKEDLFHMDGAPDVKPESPAPTYARRPTPSQPPVSNPRTSGPVISYGSGFVFSNEGYAATNLHVVAGATTVHVQQVLPTGKVIKRRAKVAITDKYWDLAVLEIENWEPPPGAHPNPPPVISSSNLKVGDSVFVVGYPLPTTLSSTPKFTRGDISDLAGIGNNRERFQHTAAIQPGSSGGPTCLSDGSVVGVVVSSLNDLRTLEKTGAVPQGVNFSVKSNMLINMMRAWSIQPQSHPPGKDPIRQVIDYTVQVVAEK